MNQNLVNEKYRKTELLETPRKKKKHSNVR